VPDPIGQHSVIDKPDTPESPGDLGLLKRIGVDSELECLVQCLSPCVSMYCRMTSIGAPPVVSKQ
jgi:hypothetical protein